MKIAVLGAGGHGQVIASVLELVNVDYEFFDDSLPWFSKIHECKEEYFIVGIGDNKVRAEVFEACNDMTPKAVYHPTAVGFQQPIYEGTFINAGAIINTSAKIGKNVIINTGAIIEHHCIIHDHAHIAPGAVLVGNVEVGEGALVGANSTVLSNVPAWSTVRAGSLYYENPESERPERH